MDFWCMKKNISALLVWVFVATLACVSVGCAHVRSRTWQFDIDGIPIAQTDASAWTLFDASSSLTRFSNRAGKESGSSVSGLGENSSSSNAVLALQLLGQIAAGSLK
jgi:hypothetical protein